MTQSFALFGIRAGGIAEQESSRGLRKGERTSALDGEHTSREIKPLDGF